MDINERVKTLKRVNQELNTLHEVAGSLAGSYETLEQAQQDLERIEALQTALYNLRRSIQKGVA